MSSSESSISSSSNASGSTEKEPFSLLSPSTWSAPSFSNMFKEESCEEKMDKIINDATKTIEKAKAEKNICISKRSNGAKPASSMFSFLGLGPKPEEPTAVKVGGRKKTQKKQKKTKKGKTNKRG